MSQARVLVVDDEEALCSILRDTLEMDGYEVEVCGDAASARECLARMHFDAALVDVLFWGEPAGIELGRHIASEHPNTSLVFMTGYAEEADIKAGLSAGAYACIAKPFVLDDVLRVIAAATDSRG